MMSTVVSRKEKISAFFWIMRPLNSITAFVAVLAAMFLAIEDEPIEALTFFFIGSAAFFTTAQANTHNDIVDIEVDRINSPERALPSGILTLKEAKIWAAFLFIMALVSGIAIDIMLGFNLGWPFSLFWAILNSALLDSYNWKFKKNGLFGNFIVGYVVGALFFYADIVVNGTFTFRIGALGLYAMFLNWGREVVKSIRDIEGDRDGGVKTIGVRYGARAAAIVGSAILMLAIASSLPLIINPITEGGSLILPVVLIIFDGIIIYKCVKLIKLPDPDYATSMKKLLLKLMLLAVFTVAVDQVISKLI